MTTVHKPKWKKAAIAAAIGGATGFAAMFAVMEWGGGEELGALGGERIALAAIGLVYLLTGLFVAFGLAAPGAGAKVLNVEDAEELIEMRPQLVRSSVVFVMVGALLILLSASGPGGGVSDTLALGATGLVVLVAAVLTWQTRRDLDELWRQMSNESAAATLALLVPSLLVWGVLAHLRRLPFTPLGVLALLAALVLAGTYVATGRRGMLTPK